MKEPQLPLLTILPEEPSPRHTVFAYRKIVSRTALCLFLLAITAMAAQTAFVALTMQWMGESWYLGVVSAVSTYLIGAPLLFLYVRLLVPPCAAHEAAPCLDASDPFTPPEFVRVAVLALGGMWALNFLSVGLVWLIGNVTGLPMTSPVDTMIGQSDLLSTFFFFCVCAPIAEEFIFRKALYPCLGRFGGRAYILLSAIAFGLFHFNLSQLFYAVWLGILLAYLYTRTGRIWVCIALHALCNFMGGLVPSVLMESQTGLTVQYLLMGASMLWAALLLPRCWRARTQAPPTQPLPAWPVREAFSALGVLLYLVLALGMIVLTLFPATGGAV